MTGSGEMLKVLSLYFLCFGMEEIEHLDCLSLVLALASGLAFVPGNSPTLQIPPKTEQRRVIICFPSRISDFRPFGPISRGPPHRRDRGDI